MSGKHQDDREVVRLLKELLQLQIVEIELLKLVLAGLPAPAYPQTTGGAITVSG